MMDKPAYRVEACASRGRYCVATRKIAKGEVALRAEVLAIALNDDLLRRGTRCAVCAAPQAGYYCGHCRHFDDSGAHTFHCPFCDVCRRGHGLGVDFHHCMRCNMCVDITQLATHVCTGAAGRACGACGGDLAATPDRVVVLGCGHPAHARCAAAPPGRCLVCARAAATD